MLNAMLGKAGSGCQFFLARAVRQNPLLNFGPGTGNIGRMKLLCAFAVWIAMGVVLGTGILMAVQGSPWLLIAGFIGFVIAVGKIGCLAH